MSKKMPPAVLKVEMIVTNRELLEHGWTSEQAERLHDALKLFLQESETIWGQAHTEFYTMLMDEDKGLREIERMDGLPLGEPRAIPA